MDQSETPPKGRLFQRDEEISSFASVGLGRPGNNNNGMEGALLGARLSAEDARIFAPDPKFGPNSSLSGAEATISQQGEDTYIRFPDGSALVVSKEGMGLIDGRMPYIANQKHAESSPESSESTQQLYLKMD